MPDQDHLTLRLVRLSTGDEWIQSHQGLSFVLPKAGSASYVCRNKSLPLLPGDVLVANFQAQGKIAAASKSDAIFWSFTITVEHLYPLFAATELGFLEHLSEFFKTPRVYARSLAVAAECQKLIGEAPSRFNVDHRSHLVRVASAVLSVELGNARSQRACFVTIEDHVKEVFEQLSMREIMNLSVGDLADRFGCSRRHLNRLFHQYFGLSVAALRMEMRMLKAVSLLRDPNAKVINIAEECGFRHLGLFNTCFKRRFGSNPGQVRKQLSEPHSPASESPGLNDCSLRTNGLCPWCANGTTNGTPHGKTNGKNRNGGSTLCLPMPHLHPAIERLMAASGVGI
jgi:AraC-like DNA-binding protein